MPHIILLQFQITGGKRSSYRPIPPYFLTRYRRGRVIILSLPKIFFWGGEGGGRNHVSTKTEFFLQMLMRLSHEMVGAFLTCMHKYRTRLVLDFFRGFFTMTYACDQQLAGEMLEC